MGNLLLMERQNATEAEQKLKCELERVKARLRILEGEGPRADTEAVLAIHEPLAAEALGLLGTRIGEPICTAASRSPEHACLPGHLSVPPGFASLDARESLNKLQVEHDNTWQVGDPLQAHWACPVSGAPFSAHYDSAPDGHAQHAVDPAFLST